MRPILAEHIIRWADEGKSRDGLPDLVYKLIVETAEPLRLDMPTSSVGHYKGYDGLVETKKGNVWVPSGRSAWEMGTGKKPQQKARSDYQNRIDKNRGINPEECTFVFVTPRLWPGKRAWADERRAEKVWKDVRVIDAGDLCKWLEASPQASRWFAARHLDWAECKAEHPQPTIGWKEDSLGFSRHPLSWLSWNARLADLIGREKEKADLLNWAQGEPGVRFRILSGEGGVGKTRLAHEVAQVLAQDQNWSAGLVPVTRPLPLDVGAKGCFLFIDYAEERRDELWHRMLEIAHAPHDKARCIRVMLLSRHGKNYWNSFIIASGAYHVWDDDYYLSEHMNASDAWAIYQSAFQRVPRITGQRDPQLVDEATFNIWLQREKINERPLLIVAAAVQTVVDQERPLVDLTARQVVDALADRENKRLYTLAREHKFGKDALTRLIALAAVRGQLDGGDLRRLANPALDIGLQGHEQLFDRLRATGCLNDDGVLPAPVPDIVAAALVIKALEGRPDMASEWLWAAIEGAAEEALSRLDRIVYDCSVVLESNHIFRRFLPSIACGKIERCKEIVATRSFDELHDGMAFFSLEVEKEILNMMDDPMERAGHLKNLSINYGSIGDFENGLYHARLSIREFERAEKDQSHKTLAFKADLLGNLAKRLGVFNQPDQDCEGLLALEEATNIRRGLVEAGFAEYMDDLAKYLSNLSDWYYYFKRYSDGVRVAMESVAIRRQLADGKMEINGSNLAFSLSNLANSLKGKGDLSEALACINEAIRLRRIFSRNEPLHYQHRLALSLSIKGEILSMMNNEKESRAAFFEAMELIEPIARAYEHSEAARWKKEIQIKADKCGIGRSNFSCNR